ncbi:MAG TPA: universal stress protein [Thermomicrobiaceae bacterium]|nr:universal stress protein [Thermomicrobiaceae bacterium]
MIGTVVVPLDGSQLAEEALPRAAAIAERSSAPLHLVRVVPSDANGAAQDEARTYLQGKARDLGDRVQVSVLTGDPAAQIIDHVAGLADALVVMTTHGRSGIGRWISGSVADRVVRDGEAPVLLIRSGMPSAGQATVRAILVALDGSSYAETALGHAVDLAKVFDAELQLVRVAETAQIYAMLTPEAQTPAAAEAINEVIDRLSAEARDYLTAVAERLRADGLRVRTETLEGFPSEQILAFEREMGTDLTVMATHGRSGLARLVFGSVAERILKLGQTPVMVIHPRGEAAESGDRS